MNDFDIVCKCKKIDVCEIKNIIKTNNVKNVEELMSVSFVGFGCRSCICKEFDKKNTRSIYLDDFFNQEE